MLTAQNKLFLSFTQSDSEQLICKTTSNNQISILQFLKQYPLVSIKKSPPSQGGVVEFMRPGWLNTTYKQTHTPHSPP